MTADDPRGGGRALPLTVVLALAAVVLGAIDGAVPRPLPFLRTGLANVITVMAVVRYGTGTAVAVNLLRSVALSLYTGTLVTPAFLLSVSGGLVSALVMGALARLVPQFISAVSLSMAGATSSLYSQLLAAMLVLPGIPAASLLLPVSLWGAVSGAVTGILAVLLLRSGFPGRLVDRLVKAPAHG